jgi:hypothetical protein
LTVYSSSAILSLIRVVATHIEGCANEAIVVNDDGEVAASDADPSIDAEFGWRSAEFDFVRLKAAEVFMASRYSMGCPERTVLRTAISSLWSWTRCQRSAIAMVRRSKRMAVTTREVSRLWDIDRS